MRSHMMKGTYIFDYTKEHGKEDYSRLTGWALSSHRPILGRQRRFGYGEDLVMYPRGWSHGRKGPPAKE
jgi:hypothetical protein